MVYSFVFKTVALVSTLLALLDVASAELETIKLTHPTGASAKVALFGAHVKSFCGMNDPNLNLLFLSNQSHQDGIDPIRGGIPIVFPNYGNAEGLPKDGFARVTNWSLVSIEIGADETQPSVAILTMAASDSTRTMWPVDFKLEYEVKLYSTKLQTTLRVHNTFTKNIDFHALLHNYFYVHDIRNNGAVISGLQNFGYIDKLSEMGKTETRLEFDVASRTDSVYTNVYANVSLEINRVGHKETVEIVKATSGSENMRSSSSATDVVVWNPGADGAKGIDDFSGDEYLHMVTIAPGRVSEKQVLPAGKTYTLDQSIWLKKLS